jgi:hypothetical protein
MEGAEGYSAQQLSEIELPIGHRGVGLDPVFDECLIKYAV